MKNFAKLLLVVCGVFLLTACGGSDDSKKDSNATKVTCKQVMGNETYDLVANLEDDKVVSVSVVANFENEQNATSFEEFVSFMGKTKKVETGVKRDGTKVTVENYAPVIESDDGTTKVVVIGGTKENLKEVLVHQNYQCE